MLVGNKSSKRNGGIMAGPGLIANLKPWPKGVSGNAGRTVRSKLPEELRGILSLTQFEVTKLISKYARMTDAQGLKAVSNPELPKLDRAILAILDKSIQKGDFTGLSFLLDRAVGKPLVTAEDDESREEREQLGKLSLNELMALVKTNLPEAS